jgi:uncharacterized membrane protein
MIDAEENKGMAVMSYIVFFIPLLIGRHKTSPFVKYHLNQGIMLAIVFGAFSMLNFLLPAVIKTEVRVQGFGTGVYATPIWLPVILFFLSLPVIALCGMGIINAMNGRTQPLPVIGSKFTFLK